MSVPALQQLAPRFTIDEAQLAADTWGFNCGPSSLAVIAGLTPDGIRPYMGDFERKRYTNPTLMFDCLKRLGIRYQCAINQQSSEHQGTLAFPQHGLARVQWEGPWTAPGVPIRVRYRHTHWVAAISQGMDWTDPGWEEPRIFDINCMCVGGWVSQSEWATSVVPWLLGECEPKANGRWHLTHVIETTVPAWVSNPSTTPVQE